MDPAWLAYQLAAGRSIESLARELGRSPSTVAYWANKHGLRSEHAARHAPAAASAATRSPRWSSKACRSARSPGASM